jgi:hypothetical protein
MNKLPTVFTVRGLMSDGKHWDFLYFASQASASKHAERVRHSGACELLHIVSLAVVELEVNP